jgi:hypothetical protein
MATWTLTAQLTDASTLGVNATDKIKLNGTAYGDNVQVGQYPDSTHISNASDVEQCTTAHVNNTKYVDGTHVSLNGAASALLSSLTTANAGFKFNFSDASAVATSAARFYAYDGTTKTTPASGVTVQAAEIGNASWTAANGQGNALALADQAAATSHDFYVALSISPTSTGLKAFKVNIETTYV